jgi:hypothetical protein
MFSLLLAQFVLVVGTAFLVPTDWRLPALLMTAVGLIFGALILGAVAFWLDYRADNKPFPWIAVLAGLVLVVAGAIVFSWLDRTIGPWYWLWIVLPALLVGHFIRYLIDKRRLQREIAGAARKEADRDA